jgi:hypothetical protein
MADTIQPYTHQDFPRWLYTPAATPGAQEIKTDTGTFYGKLVPSKEEADALDGDWYNSTAEAAAEMATEAEDLAAARKDAETAGVKFDTRWGIKRLRAEIAKATKPA